MRNLPSALAAHLAGETTTLCRCWSLTRRDGAVLGFTDHDRDLAFDDILFQARSGLEAAESTAELGFATGGGEVLGAFSAGGLGEAELARGLYDDARVSLWLVNWADIAQRVLLETGFVGEVKRSDGNFSAEVRGLGKAFDEEKGGLYVASCAADLGDARCGVEVAAADGVVAATDGRLSLVTSFPEEHGDGHFSGGRLIFTAGANLGFASEVKTHRTVDGAASLQLWQAAPASIAVGDAVARTIKWRRANDQMATKELYALAHRPVCGLLETASTRARS